MSILLEIPRIPPSPNDLLGMHWRYRQRSAKTWRDEVFYAVHQSGAAPAVPYPRARVEIERRSRGELDPDNLVGCVKPVIDGLRYARVIEDDTPAHLQLVVTQRREPKLPARTRIFVQPL